MLPAGFCAPIDPKVGALLAAAPNPPNVGVLFGVDPPKIVPGDAAPNVGVLPKDGDAPNAGTPPNAGEAAVDNPTGELPKVGVAPKAAVPGFADGDWAWLAPNPCDTTLGFPAENDPNPPEGLLPPNDEAVLLVPNID